MALNVPTGAINDQAIILQDMATRTPIRDNYRARTFALIMRPYVLELMVNGIRGPTALAKALNEQGLPTHFGKKWHKTTVHRLLRRLGPPLLADVKAIQAKQMADVKKAFGIK